MDSTYLFSVSTLGEIEKALRALPVKDARTVADWLQEDWQVELNPNESLGKIFE